MLQGRVKLLLRVVVIAGINEPVPCESGHLAADQVDLLAKLREHTGACRDQVGIL